MSTALVRPATGAAALENVLIKGDLRDLSEQDRVMYYKAVCESVGLNPLTKPFDYITLNGKLTLYAKKDAADQLRKLHNVSITALETSTMQDVYVVKAHARNGDGREDTSTGAVSIKGLAGEALANAIMKAETKAKRRVTLSICGLGMLDETEVESIPTAQTPRFVTEQRQPVEHMDVLPPPRQQSEAHQHDEIRRLVGELGQSEQAVLDWLEVGSLNELSFKRAAKVIEQLHARALQVRREDEQANAAGPQPEGEEEPPIDDEDWSPEASEAVRTVTVPGLKPGAWHTAGDEADELDRALGPNPTAGGTLTEKQLKAIYAIGRSSKRLSEGQVDDRCTEVYGVKPSELTKQEASQFIGWLKGEEK